MSSILCLALLIKLLLMFFVHWQAVCKSVMLQHPRVLNFIMIAEKMQLFGTVKLCEV
jgi:hypothetical protein